MKRLSSFGFVPSSPHSPTLPKRARGGQSELSTSSACASATVQPPQPPQVCVPLRSDVGTYSAESIRQLGNEERLWLYNNAFRPDPHHAFPAKEEYGKKCSFLYAWMKQFPWLCYSRNGDFCLSCVLFAKRFLNLGQLVMSLMTNFTRAKVTLLVKAYLLRAKTHQKQPERGHFSQFFWGSMPPDPPRKGRALHVHCPPPTFGLWKPPLLDPGYAPEFRHSIPQYFVSSRLFSLLY